MSMTDKEKFINGIIHKSASEVMKLKHTLRKNKKKDWYCCFPNCSNKAINSHLLQRNGVLDRISENGHVISFIELPKPPSQQRFKFGRVGLKEALSYPVFCNHHDTTIFRSIEERKIDLANKWDNLLLAYRSTTTERRKKEIRKRVNEKIIKGILEGYTEFPDYALNAIRKTISQLQYEIDKNKSDEFKLGQFLNRKTCVDGFEQYTFIIKIIPICSASVFSFFDKSAKENIRVPIFFNLIPNKNYTFCSFGWFKEDSPLLRKFQKKLFSGGIKNLFKIISDILCTKIENWVVNPSFYTEYLEEQESIIFDYFSNSHLYKHVDTVIEFNMFEAYLEEL